MKSPNLNLLDLKNIPKYPILVLQSTLLLYCHCRSGKADMAAVYYERIDVEGHHFGPLSNQRKNALKAVDDVILRMTKLIKVSVTLCPLKLLNTGY